MFQIIVITCKLNINFSLIKRMLCMKYEKPKKNVKVLFSVYSISI